MSASRRRIVLTDGQLEALVERAVERVFRELALLLLEEEAPATTFIYALLEPGTDSIRYIGKANDPEDRLAHHVYHSWYAATDPSKDTPKEAWVRSLRLENKQPDMRILEEVPRADSWRWERKWIDWAINNGHLLTNVARPG